MKGCFFIQRLKLCDIKLRKSQRAGANHFLQKPIGFQAFSYKIAEVSGAILKSKCFLQKPIGFLTRAVLQHAGRYIL